MSRQFLVSSSPLRIASGVAVLLGWVCALALVIVGCGRTNLDDAIDLAEDGGPPVGGCQTNADCAATPQTSICDVPTGKCVVCSDPSQCPAGQTCMSGQCAARCGSGGACPSGLSCCDPACVNESFDANHCGGCGIRCQPGQTCSGGQCIRNNTCPPGLTNCGNSCVDTTTNNNNCGGCGRTCVSGTQCVGGACTTPIPVCNGNGTCALGQACCASGCVNVVSDVRNCGNCGVVCANPANATAACSTGRCGFVCAAGFADCDGNAFNGCEANLATPANCGACGRACPPGDACVGGVCTAPGCIGGGPCPAGEACCSSGCAITSTDPRNCGGCGVICGTPPNASAACTSGLCSFVCSPGFANCDGNAANGCEANLQTDPNNCGKCGLSCGPGGACMGGTCFSGCACPAPTACCVDGGATCTNLAADPNNCGGCNVVCPTHPNSIPTCGAGGCGYACTGAFRDCNGVAADGCEVDTSSDANHCGDCTTVCPSGKSCVGGSCGGATEGAFDPIVNPTYLTPGVHNFTTITIPAGVVVYVAGGGPQSGTLDLHATGDIVVDGTIDVSGGPGSQNTISSMTTQTGRAGSGGFTGELQTAPESAACAFVVGNGGSNGNGPAGTMGTCPAGPTACGTMPFLFAAPAATFGGGAGVFTGYRAYGSGGGGPAGGAPGALGPAYPGELDCTGASGGGGATNGHGGLATGAPYDGAAGTLGQTQCPPQGPALTAAFVGGGGGGSIGLAAANDVAVAATFQAGSGGGGGSADYLNRPVFGGTSGGGGGGGALRLTTPTSIIVNGQLLANGGDGADAFIGNGVNANCDPQPGAAGGGGSGGIIYLQAPSITVGAGASLSAVGGAGGQASVLATGGSGGTGGLGRIRLSMMQAPFCGLSGAFNPPLASGCSPSSPAVAGFTYIAPYPM